MEAFVEYAYATNGKVDTQTCITFVKLWTVGGQQLTITARGQLSYLGKFFARSSIVCKLVLVTLGQSCIVVASAPLVAGTA